MMAINNADGNIWPGEKCMERYRETAGTLSYRVDRLGHTSSFDSATSSNYRKQAVGSDYDADDKNNSVSAHVSDVCL